MSPKYKNSNKVSKVRKVRKVRTVPKVHKVHKVRKFASVSRRSPRLWERCKASAISRMGGKFSARAMQLAVKLYKAHGGRYKSPSKPPVNRNSLRRWTAEDWGYAGKPKESRYLPRIVRERLTASEKRRTNVAKKRNRGQWSRQPADVARKSSALRRSLWEIK